MSCSRPAGSLNARSTSGAFGFSTSRSQPARPTTVAASAAPMNEERNIRVFIRSLPLKCELDECRECPELRILEPVHLHLERIAEETGDLRIETFVLRPGKQVAADQAQARTRNSAKADGSHLAL